MKSDWKILQERLKDRFGNELEIDNIIFIIGLQELGKPYQKYKKDDKLAIMHVAICTLLEPFKFYEFEGYDKDGWPHWKVNEKIPHLEAKEQHRLMVDAIIDYFRKESFI